MTKRFSNFEVVINNLGTGETKTYLFDPKNSDPDKDYQLLIESIREEVKTGEIIQVDAVCDDELTPFTKRRVGNITTMELLSFLFSPQGFLKEKLFSPWGDLV